MPDESSICRFRHLLERHGLAQEMLSVVNEYLAEKGLILRSGTIVDATLLAAPVSKKNADKARDPAMTSTRKNNKWHFGAKGHIGVQAEGRPLVHSVSFGTAKEHDKTHMTRLFHGQEKAIFGDSGYVDQKDKRGARYEGLYYGIADRGARSNPLSSAQKKRNRRHSAIRAKVEHPFQVIMDIWGHRKMRYRGLHKNQACFTKLCALVKLYFAQHQLLAMQ